MAIVMKIRPTVIKAKTKDALIYQIRNYSSAYTTNNSFDDYGDYLRGNSRGKFSGIARFYNLEKHNRKVRTTKRVITRGKRKGEVEVLKEVLKESHWVAHVYDVPQSMVHKGKQKLRNFVVEMKSKI